MHWSWQTPSSNNTREDSTHGHRQRANTEIRLIIFFAVKDSLQIKLPTSIGSTQSAKIRLGADCGSDHELLIAKFRLKLKKVGKTTKPFRYDLNQIPSLTVEIIKSGIRSDRQSAWRTMDGSSWHYTGGNDQDHPKEKEMQKVNMVAWGGLTNNWENKRSKRQQRKGKIYLFKWRVPKNSMKRYPRQRIEENNRMGKTRDIFKKTSDTKGNFHAKMGSIKDINGIA